MIEDGINIEPFNLNKEREEGYFDAEGNFIEYVNENEIKVSCCINLLVDLLNLEPISLQLTSMLSFPGCMA